MTAMVIEAALRGLLFAAAVGLGLRLLRIRHVPTRKAAWSLVLLASLAMPLLMRWQPGRLAWVLPARLTQAIAPPMRAASPEPAGVVVTADLAMPPADSYRPGAIHAILGEAPARPGTRSQHGFAWPPAARMLAMAYAAVCAALLLRLLIGLAAAMRLWMSADPVSPLDAPEPNVRKSGKIASPVTIGSGIVLPATYLQWSREKLHAVLAHERSHVRQLDFYLQLLAGLYTAVFWFSPLGWWLRRSLSELGEAISDRAGVDAARSRSGYAEIVLEFAAMPCKALPGVAMACSGNLGARIERLLNENLFRSAFAEGRRRAWASLLLIPAALFGATGLIRVPAASAQSAAFQQAPPPPAQAKPSAAQPAAPAAAPAGRDAMSAQTAGDLPKVEQLPPLPAVRATGPQVDETPPATVVQDEPKETNEDGFSYRMSDDGESWALVLGTGANFTFSGDWSGDAKAEIDRARREEHGPFLWFRHDGKSYIIDDPAVVSRVQQMYKPMREMGRQQEALGRRQEELSRQMQDIEREAQESAKVRLPDLSGEMAELNASLANMKVEQNQDIDKAMAEVQERLKAEQGQWLTPEKLAEIQGKMAAAQARISAESIAAVQAKLGQLQSRLGELQGEAGAKEGEFGGKMGALGAQQGQLGEQQGRIGEQQGRLAKQLNEEMQKIIEQTLHNGIAKSVQ